MQGSSALFFTMNLIKLARHDRPRLSGLIKLYERVFEMEPFAVPPAEYLDTLLTNPGIIFIVAEEEEKIVGGLTAHVLHSVYFTSAEVYVYDLAVSEEQQRKGIGTQLMKALQEYCRQQGYREVFVQADRPDQHALNFYQKTGGLPEDVIHFTYPLNSTSTT
ncbi:MAG: GNAT family N-acetyltransferase [Terrimonas ferruginea]|uniref:GNAT family N-acetyltransferase n=1 Tax=Terrimonas ferruginea TaxID=249 RepID=UPI000A502A71|nr:GNAT family N-acetyltransferase [Terrimonas ferruginea]MBN8782124.1 GNAT family N-acetyltransferase [Terrimonas ferruginea]